MSNPEDLTPEPGSQRPNKTQIKREIADVQDMASRLIQLTDSSLRKMPIDEQLIQAVILARRIRNTREGYRRQLQLITKLLRQGDHAAVKRELDGLQRSGDAENAKFHALERWRERIISGGDDAIQAFIDQYPSADRQKLRQLVRKVQKEQAEDKPPAGYRELFKYLREAADA
ncbi:ribosome biogenesis factor YjgA [Aliidiomarina maris]|uniref:Dual-action ribosomal maturation protein DarP n=1 Tax=Aliidiomarina maris TaxID=531312 RepID=A0A327X7V9_9GAMM|nr:ribosome biogenesis factor YjgA [Aliidiomarina maris]MBA3987624.1 hypothetical protein [Idiomarina sp.]RAJ99246.1 ribosome-associated protein [Aliidiomarina maris]RUO27834.1 hypothetical protein CWE07_03015 [Aliidiomarina maris]